MAFKDPAAGREYQRRWRHENPDKVKAIRRRWEAKNKHAVQAKHRRAHAKAGGFVPPDPSGPSLDQLIHEQEGFCAICARSFADVVPVLDHCHSSGKVRGALCRACNSGLGQFRENIAALMTAASYVIQHKNA